MTREQSKELLKAYAVFDEEEGVCRLRVGDFVCEDEMTFTFVCWPYSDITPVDPKFAFWYYVDKTNGDIIGADAPLIDLLDGVIAPQEYGY